MREENFGDYLCLEGSCVVMDEDDVPQCWDWSDDAISGPAITMVNVDPMDRRRNLQDIEVLVTILKKKNKNSKNFFIKTPTADIPRCGSPRMYVRL